MGVTDTNKGADVSPERVELKSSLPRHLRTGAQKTKRRSDVRLPLGFRISRQSLYFGSSSAALLLLLLMALCLYTFYQYGADVQSGLSRVEPLPEEGRPPYVQQILDAASDDHASPKISI